ncbi:hypothetical protein ACHAXT_005376 [Thalassiosira profunda]
MRRMEVEQVRRRGGDISEGPGGGATSKRPNEFFGTARHLRGDTGACNNGRPDASGRSGREKLMGKSNLNSVKARALAALESDSSDSEGDAHDVGKASPTSDAPFVTPEKSARSNVAAATADGRIAKNAPPSGHPGMIDLTGSDAEDDGGLPAQIDLTGDGADEDLETSAPIDLTGGDSDEDKPDAEEQRRDAGLPQMELSASGGPSEGSGSSVQMVSNGDGTTSPSDATGDSSCEDAPGDDAGAPSNNESSPLAADKETSLGTKSNRQEVGYILLEECEVLIPAGASIETAESGVWHDVDSQPALKSNKVGMDERCDLLDSCDLILQPCSSIGELDGRNLRWRSAGEIAPFNGLLSEIAVKISALSSKRRSDASLLAGLAVEINDQAGHYQSSASLHLRDVRMENLQTMFWGEASRNTSTALQFDSEVEESQRWKRMQASLLMTFSLPLREERQNDANGKAPQPSGKSKTLSSAHQLLGSIIRCDWSHLYTTMKRLERRAKTVGSGNEVNPSQQQQQQKKKSFFPDLLSVEELYDRISGAGKHLGNDERVEELSANSSRESRSNQAVSFQDVPEEVLVTSIAPYLQARSLHALRVTNRKLFRSLSGVVPGLKKLKLFRHQVRSLEWMEMRERKAVAEVDMLGQHKNGLPFGECSFLHEGEAVCGGDYHRAVTGGATVLLAPRPSSEHAVAKETLRFDSESGVLSLISSDIEVHRKTRCARGGLLCDDPGLGKTITVLSLILRSFGLSSEPSETGAQAADDDELFYSYWYSSFLTAHVRKPAILKLITRLIESDAEARWFVPPIDKFLDDCPDYLEVISNPMSLQDVRKKYSKSDCRDFRAFEADVRLCFSNAMTYNPPGHDVYRAAARMDRNFDELLAVFKREQIEVAAKSVSRMAKHEASRPLVDLFEGKKRADLESGLVASPSTLLVVPNPLLMHWEEQMLLHIDFRYLSSGGDSPIVYYHTSKRKVQITDSRISTDLGCVSNPIIFIDDGSMELPSPEVLARFPIVLTSYNRFTSEWKSGSVESEMRASKRGGGNVYWGEGDAPEASPLLKVSWLRVIVDEGHVMGKSSNNLIQFTSWLAAQRHWAMTGTPTQQIAAQNGLKQLFYLANFCKHEFFNQRLGREKVWNRFIREGWRFGSLASFFRLKHILSYLMVRHTKADLVEIPPPVFREVPIALSQREITTYNTIVTSIRTNIITTSMEGRTSGWQDSLLNPRQSKHASLALTNLRTSCCGGLQILPIILGRRHWNETLQMLREVHKLEDVQVKVVNDFIYRATSAELSSCHQCGVQLQSLFVIPCGHLVCSECIDSKTTSCPVCSEDFDADDFQRLQPGLDFQFNLALLEEKEAREKKQALRRVLADSTGPGGAIDLDELGGLEADENGASERQARRHKKGDACVYSSRLQDGKCTVCREEHFDCNFMNSEKQCEVCFKFAEDCPHYATKQKYVINKLLQLRSNDFADEGSKSCNVSPMAARVFARPGNKHSMHRPLKAIVFSQFRQTYEYFGDRLIRRFGGACVADYSYAKTRTEELQKFIHHPECFVMLLSKQGSVGLDLSFCTHIFFLDTIYDKSLAAQVIARAYRMGATGPVFVEQLTAKGSVEEVMSKMNAGHQVTSDSPTGNKEKLAKLHKLLVSAELIRPPQDDKQVKKRKADDGGGGIDNEHPNGKKRAKKGGVRFLEGVF